MIKAEKWPLIGAGQGGRTVLESLMAICLVSVLVLFAAQRYYSSINRVRETALTMELSNLRSAVNYYAMLNRKLPQSLKELVEKDAVVAKRDMEGADYRVLIIGKYVEGMTADPEGYPTDPFGNRYGYEPATGRVRSTTIGYEGW